MKQKTMEDAAREVAKLLKQLEKAEYRPPEWHVWFTLYQKVVEFITTDFIHEILSFVVKVEGQPDAHCVVALNDTGKYGLVAHRGRPVLRSLDQAPGEAMLEMDAISLTFVKRQDLTSSERKHLKDHKVVCKGEYSYPHFRSMLPFLEPWTLSIDEVPWLTQVLEGAVVAGQVIQSEPGVVGEEVLDELVFEQKDGQWVVDLVPPGVELTPYETPQLDKAELKSLRSELPRSAVTLDVEYDLTDLHRAGAGERGVYHAIALWVRSREDMARQVVRFAMPDRCHALTTGLMGIIRDEGVIPGVVRVASNDIYAFYEPLAKALGFKLVKEDRLESVEKAYENINKSGRQLSLF